MCVRTHIGTRVRSSHIRMYLRARNSVLIMIPFLSAGPISRLQRVVPPITGWWLDPMAEWSSWQFGGAAWWWRVHRPTGWREWLRQGGWTPGEGGHMWRDPRPPGCFLQLAVPFTANALFRIDVCTCICTYVRTRARNLHGPSLYFFSTMTCGR